MSRGGSNPAWFFVVLASLADAVGVVSYLGIQASWPARVAIALFLFVVAIISAGTILKDELWLWLSPRGSYYATTFHVKRAVIGFIAVVAAIGFGAYILVAVLHQSHGIKGPPGHPKTYGTLSPIATHVSRDDVRIQPTPKHSRTA